MSKVIIGYSNGEVATYDTLDEAEERILAIALDTDFEVTPVRIEHGPRELDAVWSVQLEPSVY